MTGDLLEGLGGLGIFLLGLVVMTESLRELAGGSLRRTLARFTRSPASGAGVGALTTALVQSSSATTVAAVGFVGAGLLTFPQALGILFGANVGTTITGWLVALLGFKLQIGTLMPPVVLVGVLLRLFRRGRVADFGTALAGFGLIFIGIGVLQDGLAGLQGVVTPRSFPPDTWSGRALLLLMGVAITLVTQSSSAGVATALAALNAGAIELSQAAAMVIGMDVGTTVTAAMATLGASTPARRTGWAHVIYNLLTGLGAFLLLPAYVWALEETAPAFAASDPELSLVAFHTLFNGLGVLAVLPLTDRFAGLVERLVPDRPSPFAQRLDRSLFADAGIAMDAVSATLFDLADKACEELVAVLPHGGVRSEEALDYIDLALHDTRDYVTAIPVRGGDDPTRARQMAALHAIDHLDRLIDRCRDSSDLDALRETAELAGLATAVEADARSAATWLGDPRTPSPVESVRMLWQDLEEDRGSRRSEIAARASHGEVSGETALRQMDAVRWLRRTAHHLWRILHHLRYVLPSPPGTLEEVGGPEPMQAERAD